MDNLCFHSDGKKPPRVKLALAFNEYGSFKKHT